MPPSPSPSILHDIHRATGEKAPSSYIVMLNDGVDLDAFIRTLQKSVDPSAFKLAHSYTVIHGFSGTFTEAALDVVRKAHEVRRIEEDAVCELSWEVKQPRAGWGLNRISQEPKLIVDPEGGFEYTYDGNAMEDGVDIYIIDSGIKIEHNEFDDPHGRSKRRATHGYVYPSLNDGDIVGHGTAVAGVAGGLRCGVYKYARLISVKVGDTMSPVTANILDGIEYVVKEVAASGRPSVVNMSLYAYDPDKALESLVTGVARKEESMCVCVQGTTENAADYAPARAASSNTVGASNINDARWKKSNWGSVVSFFAPGEMVTVPDIRNTTDLKEESGTSLAAPYVSGLIAYLIMLHGQKTPAEMTQYLKNTSLNGLLTDLPEGTPNRLVNNGF
ncbi:hypothetical protein PHLGIDRAFT_126468 [Phlebiopsis gigantea 11061_1 CR5-6]|uniref:Peptidase S8/S53 domain-containing protein n=1 Tax=Phlebiopsis gigantea (strain 11061_1 CR5-6) TaxID=745531 RepID=A0A0C3SCV8_PHLG1|nr:hypothetical protein PHLGIDRAFT_126468 [Phlebiopsis gigantea 11061_1 CR5-6]